MSVTNGRRDRRTGSGGSVDLSIDCGGIRAPNPFWLASGPPTNTAGQVMRAFEAGWGGAVWKTLGDPITNTASRYGAIDYQGRSVAGFNNIELITDRPLDVNLREITEVKRLWADHAVIGMNRAALARLAAPIKELAIVPGATHLFEEPGALERVSDLADEWFSRHLLA